MTNVIDYRNACPNNEGRAEAIERCLADIEAGKVVHVNAGGWYRNGLSLGDLSGDAYFETNRPVFRAREFGEKFWQINCDAIMVSGQLMKAGDTTDRFEIDKE